MEQCTLVIRDEVNVKIEGLDPFVRRKVSEALKFMVPYARHMPSFKMGRWDGKKTFCSVGGVTYINLLERVIPLIQENGYVISIDDRRSERDPFVFPEISETMFSHKLWPEGHPIAGEPIVLRDYQVKVIENFCNNQGAIQNVATGAGKTVTCAALSSIVEPYGRSLLIVPNRSLVEQTEDDYRNLGLDVGVIYGGRHEYGHTHTIATWQSLVSVSKKTKAGVAEINFPELVKDVVCVIVDEVHTVKGEELKELLCGQLANIPLRWGFTGTVPKEDHEFLCLLAALGPVVGEVKASELQEKGVLAECDIEIIQLIDDHVEFAEYHDEHKYLLTDPERLEWIGGFATSLSESGNVLILIDRIETGKMLRDIIPESTFVSGVTKTKDRRTEYKSVKEGGDKVLIATSGVAAVGISITHIDHILFLSYGKAFTKVIQSIGRGLRKGGDKTKVQVYDVCSTMKFDKRHLSKRKSYYAEAEYPYKQRKVDYRKKR